MAIIMAKNNSWTILQSILGDGQPFQKAQYLQSKGAEFTVGMFAVTIVVAGKSFAETMPVALTNFGTPDNTAKSLVRAKLIALIETALLASAGQAPEGSVAAATVAPEDTTIIPVASGTPAWMHSIPVPDKEVKAAQSVAGIPTTAAPVPPVSADTGFAAWQAQNAPVAPAKPKPTSEVVKLKDARALSQKVRGTSTGSVYRVAAVGKVNIAIREQSGTVSVRAEFQDKANQSTIDKLTSIGFTEGASYLSMHISLTNGAPAMRVVGSILIGAGIEFEQVATTSEQIND